MNIHLGGRATRARSIRLVGALALGAGALAILAPANTAGAVSGDTVVFANIGDVPYTSAQTPLLAALTAHVNADPNVEFVAHTGDFKGGSDSCSDAAFQTTFNGFQTFSDPFWYTPGDNDWTDCHRNSNGNFQPANRLAKVRSLYFASPSQTTGGVAMAVNTQANSSVVADQVHVENNWFNKKCATFGAIHSVSSANGRLDPNYASTSGSGSSGYTVETLAEKNARYAEVDARIDADVRWITAIFAAAVANSSDAVFLMMQAEPLITPIDNDKVYGTEFATIRAEIFAQADAHPNMHVVIDHGDQHNNRYDAVYDAVHPNISRLENWGSATGGVLAVQRWQKVTVTCGTPGTAAAVSVADQTVPAAPSTAVPEGPLAYGIIAVGVLGAAGMLIARPRRRILV